MGAHKDSHSNDKAQSALAKILCGNLTSNLNNYDSVLYHLSDSIDRVVVEIKSLRSDNISFYGPFLGRSILELGATALIARLDPLRILILQAKQMRSDFDVGKPNKSSIQWRGDVLSESHSSNLWDDKALQNPTRALLGGYYTELLWCKSVEPLLDRIAEIDDNEWLDKIKKHAPDALNARIKMSIEQLYSSLSKGIHHEFVIPLTSSFDETTIKEFINDSLFYIATLGLLLSVVTHIEQRITIDEAIVAYKDIQTMELA